MTVLRHYWLDRARKVRIKGYTLQREDYGEAWHHCVENLPPTIMHWSLGVQRELGAGLLAEATYVGTRSYHLSRTVNINQPRAEVARSSGGANINTMPYLGYGNINYSENSAESTYHALEAHVSRRFSGGLLFQVAYTFSKGLAAEGVVDVHDKRSAWGIFSLDRTHMLTLNHVYELPWLKTRADALGHVLGGWQLSGITTFQSGLPFTVTSPGDRTGTGATSRPNLVNKDAPHQIDKWFTTEAFALQPAGFFGNAGSNIIANWDLNVFKNIWLTKDSRMQIGAEFYNLFNHAQFEGVGSGLGTPTFGFLTPARDPRTIQFRLKVSLLEFGVQADLIGSAEFLQRSHQTRAKPAVSLKIPVSRRVKKPGSDP